MNEIVTVSLFCLLALSACKPEQQVSHFVKGSFTEIQQQYQNTPYFVMFWSEDCAYCTKELELFSKVQKQHPDLKLITVATDPFLDDSIVREKMSSYDFKNTDTWVFADEYPETLYFDVDRRWRGELPFTYMFDSQNNKAKKSGLLKESEITAWLTKPAT